MANELEVKEISELNDLSFNDESLVLAYTENEGVGKATFAQAKKIIGCDVNLEQTATETAPSAENKITATFRNGLETKTKTFTIKNGTGLSAATQTESTDENGLRSNAVTLKSSDTTLVQDVSFTVKDGVGIKSHDQTETTDADGLRKNTLAVAYTDGKKDSITVKDGVGIKSHSLKKATDANGLSKTTLNVAYTDGKTDTAAISDGVGIKSASQTKASTLSGELNEYTVRLTDGTESKINVYNGRAGKDFRIKKTYTSIAAMNADFSGTDVETYEFAMIDTGSVEDADTGKLYCKGETEWKYIGDLSGAQGIKGDTGNGIASITNELDENNKIKITIVMTDGSEKSFVLNNGVEYTAGENVSISRANVISVDLSSKANVSDLSSKANVSDLSTKANTEDVYTKEETYTQTEIDTKIDKKYTKPSAGIPKSDLEKSVQTLLGKADTALQSHQNISGKLNLSGGIMTGTLAAQKGLRIPTSAPSSPTNGDIWIE